MDSKADAKSQFKAIAVITLLSMGTMYGAARLLEYTQRNRNINESIAFIEKEKIFSTIFRLYPEAKERVRTELDAIYRSNQDARARAETFSRVLIQEYFQKSVPLASNESIAEFLSWNAMLVGRLQTDPVACVDYYLGRRTPDVRIEGADYSVSRREGDLKAAVIASAKEAQSPALPYASMDEAMSVLAERYMKSRQDFSTAAKLEKVGELPADEGCRVARAFSSALAEGTPTESARLYKHFTKAGLTVR